MIVTLGEEFRLNYSIIPELEKMILFGFLIKNVQGRFWSHTWLGKSYDLDIHKFCGSEISLSF